MPIEAMLGAPVAAPAPTPAADPAATPPPAAPPAAGTPAPAPQAAHATGVNWLPDADPDTAGYVQNKGWNGPADVLTSYRNLEKLMGADRAGRTVEIPKDPDDAVAMGQFYERLGRPNTAEEYGLPLPENADPEFAKWAKETFHEIGLTSAQARVLTEKWNGLMGGKVEAGKAASQARLVEEGDSLRKEWGAAFEQNCRAVDMAVAQFGLDQETVVALRDAIGPLKAMKFFHQIGSKLGEDVFVSGGQTASNIPTPAAAQAQLKDLTMQKDFLDAFLNPSHPGHKAAVDKKAKLTALAYPQ